MPKPLRPDVATGDILHQWMVKEYDRYERGRSWYIVVAVLAVLMVLYGMVSNNFIFSLIIILAIIILYLQSRREPIAVPFRIAELGVIVGDRLYSYGELASFYIIYQPPDVKTLFIVTKQFFRPNLRIPLGDTDPNDIRSTLRGYLPEDLDVEQEPASDMLARRWRIL